MPGHADGHREILGVASSEDGAGWLAFLRGRVARGPAVGVHAGAYDLRAARPGIGAGTARPRRGRPRAKPPREARKRREGLIERRSWCDGRFARTALPPDQTA
ncbi:MAG: hypothetical protein ACRDN0_29830 [Trebonia sp.]